MRAEAIEFEVDGERVVGLFFEPEGEGPFPGLVFTGPLTSVKEQVPSHYARALAERGFAGLVIDHRHFGESGGEPRQYEHPPRKVEDLRAALAWVAARTRIDALKLGAVGVCAGAGYMAGVVAEEPRVRAFAAVAGFMHDNTQQRAWMGDGYAAAIDRAVAARRRYEQTGEVETIPAVGLEGEVAMPLREAFDYYGTERGAVPNYRNLFAVMSREHTLPWDAVALASDIDMPTLMVHSENALAPALARRFFDELGGFKRIEWVESEGQIDFYDDPARIEPAADLLAAHFHEHL